MPESDRKTEALVGLFIIIGLVVLGALIVQFGRFGERLRNHYPLTVRFEDAAGVIKGSEIRMGGARIGKVAETPSLTENLKVQVELSIHESIRIPEGSSFQIASATLLGDKLIVVTPPADPDGRFLEPGSTLAGGGPSGLDAIQDNAVAVSRDVRRLLGDAERTIHSVDGAIDDIRIATGALTETMRRINTSLLSDENLANVRATLAHLEQASGSLDPAVGDARTAIASIEKAAASAGATFDNANARIADLAPAIEEIPRAIDSLSEAADQAAATLDRIEQGQGLLGTLAYDEEVSDDARTFIRNLKEQGILRYRDQETPQDDPRERFQGRRR